MEKIKQIDNFKDYIELALRTESINNPLCATDGLHRLLHGTIGVVTEVNELRVALNLNDNVNTLEEIGDIFWYIAIITNCLVEDFNFKDNENSHLVEDINFLLFEAITPTDNIFDKIYNSSTDSLDLLKKVLFYNKPVINVIDDLGINLLNTALYASELVRQMGEDISVVLATNINKLKARYPEKYSDSKADERDLNTERDILTDSFTIKPLED